MPRWHQRQHLIAVISLCMTLQDSQKFTDVSLRSISVTSATWLTHICWNISMLILCFYYLYQTNIFSTLDMGYRLYWTDRANWRLHCTDTTWYKPKWPAQRTLLCILALIVQLYELILYWYIYPPSLITSCKTISAASTYRLIGIFPTASPS